MYRFRQREYYTAIQSQLKTLICSYRRINFDERVTTTYENKRFILKIAYNRKRIVVMTIFVMITMKIQIITKDLYCL